MHLWSCIISWCGHAVKNFGYGSFILFIILRGSLSFRIMWISSLQVGFPFCFVSIWLSLCLCFPVSNCLSIHISLCLSLSYSHYLSGCSYCFLCTYIFIFLILSLYMFIFLSLHLHFLFSPSVCRFISVVLYLPLFFSRSICLCNSFVVLPMQICCLYTCSQYGKSWRN